MCTRLCPLQQYLVMLFSVCHGVWSTGHTQLFSPMSGTFGNCCHRFSIMKVIFLNSYMRFKGLREMDGLVICSSKQ